MDFQAACTVTINGLTASQRLKWEIIKLNFPEEKKTEELVEVISSMTGKEIDATYRSTKPKLAIESYHALIAGDSFLLNWKQDSLCFMSEWLAYTLRDGVTIAFSRECFCGDHMDQWIESAVYVHVRNTLQYTQTNSAIMLPGNIMALPEPKTARRNIIMEHFQLFGRLLKHMPQSMVQQLAQYM